MKRLCVTALVLLLTLSALAAGKSGTIVYINGAKYYIHTVQPGETLYALSKAYEVGEKVILQNNPEASGGLKAGSNVRIPFVAQRTEQLSEKKLRKTFSAHTVAKGETLYAISRRYQIAIPTIVEDNPNLDPIHLKLGEQILLRKMEIGHEDEAGSKEQWEQYRKSLNSVADDGYAYHIVHPGETFYALSHRFGISEEELSKLNNGLKAADLKAGAMVKVPKKAGEETVAIPAESTTAAQTEEIIEEKPKVKEVAFKALRAGEPLDIALMLPLATTGDANGNYLEFYQGFLLGMDSLRHSGRSANVTLYNTGRDREKIRRIVESDEFRSTDLVVGPVYEEGLHPVIRFAEEHGVPVVSPLANVTGVNSDALFQLAPAPALKHEKLAQLIGPDKQITLIYTESTDKEFEQEMLTLLGNSDYDRYNYRYVHPSRSSANSPSDLTPLVGNGLDNVIVVMSDNEVDVDRILAAIASADTNLSARGRTTPRFTVLGNARWNRYNNIDRTMFFKDRVTFISTYHAKRDSQAVTGFDSAYIRAFGTMPSLYSYRGYDAAMIFGPAMYNDIQYDMQGRTYTPLQTTYRFGQDAENCNHVNQNWMRVTYNNDFTITVE